MENADLSGADTYDIGSEVTITASTYVEDQDGNQYRLIGWQHNEEFISDESGLYEFILNAETAGIYTAIYEEEHTITIDTQSQNTIISISADKAYSGENVTMQVNEDTQVTDDSVIFFASRLYYKTADSEEEVEIYKQDGQYSFTMPENDITIFAELDVKNRINDFVIENNAIMLYTGTETTVTLPSSYSYIEVDCDKIVEFGVDWNWYEYIHGPSAGTTGIYQYYIYSGNFVYKTAKDSEFSQDKVTDVRAWMEEMSLLESDSYPISIKLPTSYTITKEDAQKYSSYLNYSLFAPFQYVLDGKVSSFKYQLEGQEVITVNSDNFMEEAGKLSTDLSTFKDITFSEIRYIEKIAYEGEDIEINALVGGAVSDITHLIIPNTITEISQTDADQFEQLERVDYLGSIDQFALINSYRLLNNAKLYIDDQLITEVVIDTEVVNSAFQGYKYLEKVTLTENVKEISDSAFSGCTGLTSVTIPEGVESLGHYAFSGCSSLTEVTIPASVTSIGYMALLFDSDDIVKIYYQGTIDQWASLNIGSKGAGYSNKNLHLYIDGELADEITINTNVNFNVFNGIESITKVTIGEGVTSIGSSAFYYCSNLTEITLPASLTSIGGSVFSSCSSLATVTFAEGSQLASIGYSAFSGCSGLTEITLPASITSIESYAFSGCIGLTKITLPSSLKSIEDYAFDNCYALALVINNSSTLTITKDSSANGYVGYYAKEVVNRGEVQGRIEIIDNVQYYINDTKGEFIALAPAISRNAINSISLADGTKEINQYAFNNCSNLTDITLPSSLTSIGEYAFSGCSALQSIEIPASVTSIGSNAFQNCTSLAMVTFAEDSQLESIGSNAFYGCNISGIEYNNGRYLASEDNNYFILAEVVDNTVSSFEIMENCQIIGPDAFSGCTNLTSITIPASVISIGEYAFYDCTSLATVTFAEGSQLASIGSWAFGGCSSLTEITLPSSLTSIGERAFSVCSNLATVTFAEGSQLESIGSYAFSYCSNLTEITLPTSVTSIGSSAFDGCSNLTEITLPASLTSIGSDAFQNCTSLATVTIESDDIYKVATGTYSNHAGYLLQYATTVRVLTTIVDTCYNSYLENTSNFTTSVEGEYTVFTKVNQ